MSNIGAIFAIPVFHHMNAKLVLVTCLILNSAGLALITISQNYYIFLLSRFLVGFFQVISVHSNILGLFLYLFPSVGRNLCRHASKKDFMVYPHYPLLPSGRNSWLYHYKFFS